MEITNFFLQRLPTDIIKHHIYPYLVGVDQPLTPSAVALYDDYSFGGLLILQCIKCNSNRYVDCSYRFFPTKLGNSIRCMGGVGVYNRSLFTYSRCENCKKRSELLKYFLHMDLQLHILSKQIKDNHDLFEQQKLRYKLKNGHKLLNQTSPS